MDSGGEPDLEQALLGECQSHRRIEVTKAAASAKKKKWIAHIPEILSEIINNTPSLSDTFKHGRGKVNFARPTSSSNEYSLPKRVIDWGFLTFVF